MNTLSIHREKARRAHYWTSFDPDRAADRTIAEYSTILDADLLDLSDMSEEARASYKESFERFFVSLLSSMSNCASAMVTGPANFPTQKMERNRSRERAKYEAFMEWREKAKRAIKRKEAEPKTFDSELERYRAELVKLKAIHEANKEGNKRIQAARKTGEDLTEYLVNGMGVAPHMVDWTMQRGFYVVNSLANVKRVEERIQMLEKKKNTETKEHAYNGFRVVENLEIDRIQVIHDERPPAEVCALLKKHGFKWAPSQKAWQRQLTPNAIASTRCFISELTQKQTT